MSCNRCGMDISDGAVERRKARGTYDGRCSDCRPHRSNEVKYDGEPCRPWRGEVDEDLNPIDKNLKLYLPGVRTCGHKDCVNKNHIISPINVLELERNDISYRTGKPTTFQHFLQELSA